jgi:ATP-dependent protease ClpP protease subunit
MPTARYHHRKRSRNDDDDDDENDGITLNQGEPKSVESQGNNIYFYCDVSVATVLDLQMTLARIVPELKGNGVDHVNLYVQSSGGDAFAGLAAYDVIRTADIWVNTIVVGCTCSAATLLTLAGHSRYMMRNAQMLIHQVQVAFEGTTARLRDEVSNNEALTDQMVGIYTLHSWCSADEIRAMMADEAVTLADRAQELGFVTCVW